MPAHNSSSGKAIVSYRQPNCNAQGGTIQPVENTFMDTCELALSACLTFPHKMAALCIATNTKLPIIIAELHTSDLSQHNYTNMCTTSPTSYVGNLSVNAFLFNGSCNYCHMGYWNKHLFFPSDKHATYNKTVHLAKHAYMCYYHLQMLAIYL